MKLFSLIIKIYRLVVENLETTEMDKELLNYPIMHLLTYFLSVFLKIV